MGPFDPVVPIIVVAVSIRFGLTHREMLARPMVGDKIHDDPNTPLVGLADELLRLAPAERDEQVPPLVAVVVPVEPALGVQHLLAVRGELHALDAHEPQPQLQ